MTVSPVPPFGQHENADPTTHIPMRHRLVTIYFHFQFYGKMNGKQWITRVAVHWSLRCAGKCGHEEVNLMGVRASHRP